MFKFNRLMFTMLLYVRYLMKYWQDTIAPYLHMDRQVPERLLQWRAIAMILVCNGKVYVTLYLQTMNKNLIIKIYSITKK